MQTEDDLHADKIVPVDPALFDIELRELPEPNEPARSWLNVARSLCGDDERP